MIMTYVRGGLALLNAGGAVAKLIAAGVLVAAVLTAYGVWHHKVYQQGVDAAIAGIAREDAKWLKRGQDARAKWEDCRGQNRDWDQSTGRCQ